MHLTTLHGLEKREGSVVEGHDVEGGVREEVTIHLPRGGLCVGFLSSSLVRARKFITRNLSLTLSSSYFDLDLTCDLLARVVVARELYHVGNLLHALPDDPPVPVVVPVVVVVFHSIAFARVIIHHELFLGDVKCHHEHFSSVLVDAPGRHEEGQVSHHQAAGGSFSSPHPWREGCSC